MKKVLVEKGPVQVKGIRYPVNSNGRRFTKFHFVRKLPNGEAVDRAWLVYSALFCFCCKIFSLFKLNYFVESGYCDWQHASQRLHEHETSPEHTTNMLNWINMQKALTNGGSTTIDHLTERVVESERQYWKNVFERLIAITKFLSQHFVALKRNYMS